MGLVLMFPGVALEAQRVANGTRRSRKRGRGARLLVVIGLVGTGVSGAGGSGAGAGGVGAAAAAAFAPKAVVGTGVEQTHAVATGDVDGDGDLDAVTADYVGGRVLLLRNDGATFTTVVVDEALPGAYPVHMADLDADGDVDLFAGGYLSDTLAWYDNDGAGGFTRRVVSSSTDGVHSIATADLDGDGDIDVVVANQDSQSVWWLENDGAQQFRPRELDGAAWGAKSSEIVDIDGDGDLDIVSANSATTEFAVLLNDGTQRFTKRVVDRTLTGAYDVCVGDLDGDDDPDTAIASSLTNTVAWFRNDGTGRFTRQDVDTSASGVRSVACVDLDGDGDVDLLAASPNDDTVAWYDNDGAGRFTWRPIDLAADGAYGIDAADVDGDGDLDVLAANRDADEIALYRRTGTPSPATSTIVDIAPTRILDTRAVTAVGYRGPKPAAGGVLRVQIAGRGGLPPSGVTAVVANLTITESTTTGFVQAFPTGQGTPGASSNLNVDGPGRTIAAAGIIPVGPDGSITIVNQAGGHLLVDVSGYTTLALGAVSAGRLVPTAPTRLLDTRRGLGHDGVVAAGARVRVDVRGGLGLPAGARAVVGNLTATGSVAALYVQAGPSGPLTVGAWSNLNLDGGGQTRANQVVVPLGGDGAVQFSTSAATHLVFDVTGWITGADDEPSVSGRFVPLRPARLLDTRPASAVGYTGPKPGGAALVRVAVAGRAGLPADPAALSLTVTATESAAPGYVQLAPAGQLVPAASSVVNVDRVGQTIANGSIVGSTTEGVDLHVPNGAHLVLDVSGYFTR